VLATISYGVLSSAIVSDGSRPTPTATLPFYTSFDSPTPNPTFESSGGGGTATATLPPRPLATATLGGTQDTYTAAFGSSTLRGNVAWYSITTPEGWHITFCFCSTQPGRDGKPHEDTTRVEPVSGAFSTAQESALIKRFLPPDAVHVRDFTDPYVGHIHDYKSKRLAATFPASSFIDSGAGANPPQGTASVACDHPACPGCDFVLRT